MTVSRRFAVRRKWITAVDLVGLELVPTDGQAVDPFTAGAHVEFTLKRAGAPPMLRHYSLCNAPHERDAYIFGVKREEKSRGGSHLIHDSLNVGDTVEVGAPRNHFPLSAAARSHLLLAAGIGVTPLLAMAQELQEKAQNHQLHYFVRSVAHVALPERLKASRDAGRVHIHAGLNAQETMQTIGQILQSTPVDAHAYACGPKPFMDAVADLGQPRLGSGRMHFEHFQAAVGAPTADDRAFEVVLQRSGRACTVRADQTIVQALEGLGCAVEVSCEQGVCGTCLTDVLEGEPDHRDFYLSNDERQAGKTMLLCVSRARSSRLVLDL